MRIPREHFIRKLLGLGFVFKRQADRVMIYKRGTDYVHVQRRDWIDEQVVRALLKGRTTPADVDEFLRCVKA